MTIVVHVSLDQYGAHYLVPNGTEVTFDGEDVQFIKDGLTQVPNVASKLQIEAFKKNNVITHFAFQSTHTSVVTSGEGSVAIGGSRNGAVIITGNGNVTGSNQTVIQTGKYNINIR